MNRGSVRNFIGVEFESRISKSIEEDLSQVHRVPSGQLENAGYFVWHPLYFVKPCSQDGLIIVLSQNSSNSV
jgi:hypothetical protein